MSKRNATWLATALLFALAVPGWSAEALKVTPTQLVTTEHKLGNGLRLLMLEDHSVPVVDLQVWYHVGSKDEKKGRTGFAHLFEHMMFKGSDNVEPEAHKTFISSIGGRYNATTDFDRTLYFETFPSNYLERILWLEADRMRSLRIDEATFKSERDVVKEERRLRIDNPPFGRLFEVVLNNTYTTHPYKILPIGSMTDLEAATVEDVREFHDTFYKPNNATLMISGDLDPKQTIAWVEKYFGNIPAGKPIVRQVAQEPQQTAERRATDYGSSTPLPAVVMTYHIPKVTDPDTAALEVASNILSGGESSRLYKKMVYDKQMAVAAGGQTIRLEDPGVFFFFSILQAGIKPEDGEKELSAEVDLLKSQPVSESELVKAKNQLISEGVFNRETVSEKGTVVGFASVIMNDITLANRQIAAYQKVTAADIQRVANKYFAPTNRTVVYMLPESMRPADASAKGEVKP